jgi:tetratricopeptide (TPR) repeat protein
MLSKDMSKGEIDRALEGKGDFIQIDLLTNFIETKPPVLMKRYAYLKLAKIYQDKKMFKDSAKMYENLGNISPSFSEKLKYFLIAAEFYIKDGAFEQADYVMEKAMTEANSYERAEIYHSIKQYYKNQAQEYESQDKRNQASKIYEKLLSMNIAPKEEKEICKKLLDLYEKLGKFKEYNILKKGDA